MTFAGLEIYPQANWPKVQDGTKTVRFPGHSLIFWLAKWLPIDPYITGIYPKYRDADPLIHGNRMFCSFRQHDQLKRETVARPKPPIFCGIIQPGPYT